MTIKNWKKILKRKNSDLWVHKENNYRDFINKESVEVGKQLLHGNDWFLNISKKNGTAISKRFKTKSKALAYAKAYMRKH